MNLVFRAFSGAAFLGASSATAFALPNPAEVIQAKGGPIKITPIYHGSLQIEYRGRVIQVDPFSGGDYTGAKKADLILITHTHPDHLDTKAISKVMGPYVHVMAPPAAVPTLERLVSNQRGEVTRFLNGTRLDFDSTSGKNKIRIVIQAVPAYNLVRGPKPGQKFHPKGQFNGYVLTMGGKRIYIAGDTEAVPEMKALRNIDVAFLPMNLPYTMTPREAAAAARAFKPKVVYPYHYRFPFTKANTNPQQFQRALAGSGIQVRIRSWYAHPA